MQQVEAIRPTGKLNVIEPTKSPNAAAELVDEALSAMMNVEGTPLSRITEERTSAIHTAAAFQELDVGPAWSKQSSTGNGSC